MYNFGIQYFDLTLIFLARHVRAKLTAFVLERDRLMTSSVAMPEQNYFYAHLGKILKKYA